MAKKLGFKVIYNKRYPPGTVDFTPLARAMKARNPDLVYVGSYPPGSVGFVKAAKEVVGQNAIPLLGATAVAIFAFASIGGMTNNTGEFCRALYYVILISLSLSWLTAVTVTPLLGVMFLKAPEGDPDADPYDSPFYRRFGNFLRGRPRPAGNPCHASRSATMPAARRRPCLAGSGSTSPSSPFLCR